MPPKKPIAKKEAKVSKKAKVKQDVKLTATLTSNKRENDVFPIVAIGTSAGGLDALGQFFKRMPAENQMAFIVITHLDPEHKSIMPELITTYTPMTVSVIKNGTIIQANNVYVLPPNKNASIKNATLFLGAQDEPHYTNLPINFFFQSLAASHGERAVAIILSGFGTDGSVGLRDIKQQGGLILVQDPESTEYDSMPLSAINTGLVDYVGPAYAIFEHLQKLLHDNQSINKISIELQQIFSILRSKTGYDFSGYKISVLNRRIDRQMRRLHLVNIEDYIRYLRLNINETEQLFKDLLISVTCFFRDPEAFHDLKQVVLPKLLKNKPSDYIIRIWVPGCATGEEVYSLAIILREYMDETKRYYHVQIFGTDIDMAALEIARAASYPETITQEVSPERLKCFFHNRSYALTAA